LGHDEGTSSYGLEEVVQESEAGVVTMGNRPFLKCCAAETRSPV